MEDRTIETLAIHPPFAPNELGPIRIFPIVGPLIYPGGSQYTLALGVDEYIGVLMVIVTI